MNIEIRKRGVISYYYLAHSYRKLGKVRKIRVYLGRDLAAAELNKKQVAAEVSINEKLSALTEIRDPYKTVLTSKEMDDLKGLLPFGKIKLSHLSEDQWLKFTETFAYDTNAIEGSTVEQKEVTRIIERNEWPERSKAEISETIGVAEAVKYVRETKDHLSIPLILELHRLVFKNSKDFAGHTRRMGEEVAVIDSMGNIAHRGAPSSMVIQLLKSLIAWYEENKTAYPPIVLAAVVHNQFENIHPFRDGNGRVGRLLLINILLKHGLPPVNIELSNQREYYEALQRYERGGDIRPTIELLLREYRALKKEFGV